MRFSLLVTIALVFACSEKKKKASEPLVNPDGSKVVRTYYGNGKTKSEATMKDGVRNGLSRTFDKTGGIALEIPYLNDLRDGKSRRFFEGGKQLYQTTEYKEDKMQGMQVKYRTTGELLSEARYENDFPCEGIKEYLENKSLKKKYPQIVVTVIDRLQSQGSYTLEVSMSEKVKSVRYYTGNLSPAGCLSDDLDHMLLDPARKTAILKLTLPPGAFLMEEFNFIAAVETLYDNTYITQKKHHLAINN